MALNYECHVTLPPEFLKQAEEIAPHFKFKTSILVGDEELGPAKHVYCTSHDGDLVRMKDRMEGLAYALTGAGVVIRRKKIELIILDEIFK